MKLTFYKIYYHLKKRYDARRISCNPCKIKVERPVYYRDGQDCRGHMVLIFNEELMKIGLDSSLWKDCIFICFGEVDDIFCRIDTDLLVLDERIPREQVLNDLQEIFQYFEEMEYSVTEVFMENQDFGELMECFGRIFETPLALMDASFSYVALADREGRFANGFMNESSTLPMQMVSQLISDPAYQRSMTLAGVYTYTLEQVTFLCRNLFFEGKFIGKLMAVSCTSPLNNEYHKDLLLMAAGYVERMYERFGAFHMADRSLDSLHELLRLTLKGSSVPGERLRSALGNLSWSEEDAYYLIQMRPSYRYDKSLYDKYLCPQMEQQWKDTCCVAHNDSLMVLLNGSRLHMTDFQPELAYFLRENLLAAGISRKFRGFDGIQNAFKQTDIALELGMRKDATPWYFRFDDYALDYILIHGRGVFEPEQICAPGILKLIEHDEKMHTEYYKTLYCYLQCRYNAAVTAKKLFIHRSTFLNRLERIGELIQTDLEDFRSRLYLSVSFYILEEGKQ